MTWSVCDAVPVDDAEPTRRLPELVILSNSTPFDAARNGIACCPAPGLANK